MDKKYIDAESLYNQIVEKEELARQRVIDTPSRFPNGDINPYAVRYATQLDERTTFKFMLTDAPAVDIPRWIPVTEGLPAYGEDVLLSMNGDYSIGYLVPTYDGRRYEWHHSGWFYYFNEVDAWMPLPEPYKGGEEE